MSYPGYPQPGYPQQGGYPPQQGYPPQPGYPAAGGPGYPGAAQPAYPMQGGGMPVPEGGAPYPGGGGYPAQPAPLGFGAAPPPGAAMPTPGGDPYGAQAPYNAQPNPSYGAAPPQGYSQYNQPAPPPAAGGYPGGGGAGYPAQPPAPASYTDPYRGAAAPPPQGQYPAPATQGGAYPAPAGQGGAYPAPAGQGGAYPAPAAQGGAYPAPASQGGYQPAPAAQGGAYPSLHGGGAAPTAAMGNLSLKPREDGTVRTFSPFDAEKDAQVLRKAMKGMGTDEKAIIDVLAARTNAQRQQIKLMFKTMFGKDLEKELKRELSGNFEDAVIGLMTPPFDYDAQQLNKSIKGAGTDEGCLVEILCSRNNADLHAIKDAYKKLFKKDLEKEIMSDTSGHFKRLLVSLITGGRQENMPLDMERAKKDARDLYQAGEARWGTDESRFNQILCTQSHVQLRQVFEEYKQVSRRTMEQAIRNEFSGDVEDGMLAVVKVVQNRPAYFADRLYKSMKGLGTDDRTLVRVMVTRCEVDMVQIKQEFQKAYSQSLEQFIQGDCSGDYKKMLIALCGRH